MPSPRRKSDPSARLLRLAGWIARKGEVPRDELEAQLAEGQPSDATARDAAWARDAKALRLLGVPVTTLDDGRQREACLVSPCSCTLAGLALTEEEAAVAWTAGQAALRAHEHPLRSELETALRALAAGASGSPPRAAALERDATALEPDQLRERLDVIAEALRCRRRVKLAYHKLSGEVTPRPVDVYGYAWRGQWLVVGYCHLRQAIRTFLLARVQAVALEAPARSGPDYQVPDDFDIRVWSRQEPWDVLVHEPLEAAIRFRGALAPLASQLLPRARVTTEPDGARLARVEVRNLRGLVRQALAWGCDAELVEPPRARLLAREMLAPLLAASRAGAAP